MRAETIGKALGGRKVGSGWMARCPAHDDHKPSLSISSGDDAKILVRCFAGCNQEAVIDALKARGLWPAKSATSWHSSRRRPQRPLEPPVVNHSVPSTITDNPNREVAPRIWREAKPVSGTLIETYLKSRGITIEPPQSLRYHPGLKHGPTGLVLPAMIGGVQGPDGAVQAIHRTFLDFQGRKASVSSPKMMLGRCAGGAVRLARACEVLAIAEGIETALSVQQGTEIPTWAALSTSGLKSLVLSHEVREVIIFADGDEAGEKAAQEAARRFSTEGRSVRIARPPEGAGDFNDILQKEAAQ